MEFKKKMAADRENAWKDYLELCRVGGSLSYLETLKHAHLAIPFAPGAVAEATDYAKAVLLDRLKAMES